MATHEVLLKDVKPMLRGFDCQVIVLQRAEADPHFTRHGDAIYKYIVADKTGSIVLSIWGDRAKCIKSGDILRVTGAEAKIRKGQLEMEALRASKVRRIGQDTMCFNEQPNYSEFTPQQLQDQYQQHPQQQQQSLQPPRDPRDPGHHPHHHHHPSISQQLPSNSAPRNKYSNFANDRRQPSPSPRGRGGFRGKVRRIR
ncbi:predicted protein [Lichtheimia corymbifera JMRC:FSU:9682]|uniref:Uncharacterized protein n=1 Tax=Lichtheimia corymbifera JMRC:FSU:9682 TaxID=1263082 RepID=A0A068S8X1_9FUNG|nr:predicted protein [Lichtheimia corymbifera JMRC:FSU:9682]